MPRQLLRHDHSKVLSRDGLWVLMRMSVAGAKVIYWRKFL
jgi:hypothetical protein